MDDGAAIVLGKQPVVAPRFDAAGRGNSADGVHDRESLGDAAATAKADPAQIFGSDAGEPLRDAEAVAARHKVPRTKAGVGLHDSSESEDERLHLDDVEVLRTKAADRTKAVERVVLGDNHQAAHLFDPVLAPRVVAAGSDGVHANDNDAASAAHHGGDANANNAAPEARLAAEFPARRWMLRGARELLSVAADGVLHGVLYVVESPVSRLVADLVPELRDVGHGMLALATLLAIAARPLVRWSAALLRGARVFLSVAADNLFAVVLNTVESPMFRYVGNIVPEVRGLGYALLAFMALVAMAVRPRAA